MLPGNGWREERERGKYNNFILITSIFIKNTDNRLRDRLFSSNGD